MQLGMRRRISCDFKQRLEHILDDLLKSIHQTAGFVDVIEARDLNQPANVVGKELVIHDPRCKLIPFIYRLAVDRYAPLHHLIFAGLQVGDHFFGNLSQVASMDEIVRLKKDCSEARLADRVVLEIEFVEAMERVGMRLFG